MPLVFLMIVKCSNAPWKTVSLTLQKVITPKYNNLSTPSGTNKDLSKSKKVLKYSTHIISEKINILSWNLETPYTVITKKAVNAGKIAQRKMLQCMPGWCLNAYNVYCPWQGIVQRPVSINHPGWLFCSKLSLFLIKQNESTIETQSKKIQNPNPELILKKKFLKGCALQVK